MATAPQVDWPSLAPQIAGLLLGEANQSLSTRSELRFGSHGSLAIDLEKGTFFDHEAKTGGGMVDLIQRQRGGELADAMRWMEDNGLKEPAEVWMLGRNRPPTPSPPATYVYADADGAPVYRVTRKMIDGGKTFVQAAADGSGGWRTGRGCMEGVPRLPYRLPDIAKADPGRTIFIVEGEKDADRLAGLGLLASTNSGGASKFSEDLAPHFAGRKIVVIPDNDTAGRDHAAQVIGVLKPVAAAITLLALHGLPEKGDVSDWLDAGHSAEDLKDAARAALADPVLVDADAASDSAGSLLPLVDAGSLEGQAVPDREWMLEGWEPKRSCVYLTGLGATGKSLLSQQRMTCSAANVPFLGVQAEAGVSLYITCEDDLAELHRRQDAINKALGITWANLRGRLWLASLKGALNKELATFDAEGRLSPTPRWHSLLATIESVGATHVVLDNVAHFFTGNENIRNQVAAFVGLLDGLAERINGVVLLLGHPNKAGQEYSGSTAWENQVRARLYLKPDEEDPDGRVLTNSKPNYSARGAALSFHWFQWAFTRLEDLPGNIGDDLRRTIAATNDNEVFLKCLRERTRQKRAVSEKRSPSYAPTVFARMPEAKEAGVTPGRLEAAMDRLFRIGKIERGALWKGADRKPVEGLREIAGNGSDDPGNSLKSFAGDGAGDGAGYVRETVDFPEAGDGAGNAGDVRETYTQYNPAGAAPSGSPAPAGLGDIPPAAWVNPSLVATDKKPRF